MRPFTPSTPLKPWASWHRFEVFLVSKQSPLPLYVPCQTTRPSLLFLPVCASWKRQLARSMRVSLGALQTLGFLSCHTKLSMHGLKRTFWIGGRAKKRKRCHGSLVFSVLDIKLALFRWNGLTSICVHNKEASFLDLRAPDLIFFTSSRWSINHACIW